MSSSSIWDSPQSRGYVFPVFTLLAYFSPLPAVIWLVKSEGFVSRSLATPFTQLVGIVSAKGSAAVKDDPRKFVVALTAFYILSVFIFSAVMSVTGQSMGNKEGYRNREPRLYKKHIPAGLPNRMISAHEALIEIFPAYAVTAALVVSFLASGNNSPEALVSVNALVLHVFLKIFIYVPVYLVDQDGLRSISHMTSISALLVALWSIITEG